MAKCLEEFVSSKFEPGAAQYGNFINYYSFNSVDKRIKVIPDDLLAQLGFGDHRQVVCLDIGCNSGDLTVGLYSHLLAKGDTEAKGQKHQELHILGIDLDPVLVTRCIEANPYPLNVAYQHLDIMNDISSINVLNKYLEKYGKTKFNLVFCFSVTMWIHLNHGDRGLHQFLQKISSITTFLLLEPQDWKCYKSASRRTQRLKCGDVFNLNSLEFRYSIIEDIDRMLQTDFNMELVTSFGETTWGRKMYLYKQKCVVDI